MADTTALRSNIQKALAGTPYEKTGARHLDIFCAAVERQVGPVQVTNLKKLQGNEGKAASYLSWALGQRKIPIGTALTQSGIKIIGKGYTADSQTTQKPDGKNDGKKPDGKSIVVCSAHGTDIMFGKIGVRRGLYAVLPAQPVKAKQVVAAFQSAINKIRLAAALRSATQTGTEFEDGQDYPKPRIAPGIVSGLEVWRAFAHNGYESLPMTKPGTARIGKANVVFIPVSGENLEPEHVAALAAHFGIHLNPDFAQKRAGRIQAYLKQADELERMEE